MSAKSRRGSILHVCIHLICMWSVNSKEILFKSTKLVKIMILMSFTFNRSLLKTWLDS